MLSVCFESLSLDTSQNPPVSKRGKEGKKESSSLDIESRRRQEEDPQFVLGRWHSMKCRHSLEPYDRLMHEECSGSHIRSAASVVSSECVSCFVSIQMFRSEERRVGKEC